MKFPFVQSQCDQRTHKSHMNDVSEANLKGTIYRGVKGPSSFSDFINIGMIRSFPRDSMHGDVLGITEQMWDLMRIRMPPLSRVKLDSMLLQIQPPHEVHRVPCKLSKKSCWKATNWKAYMLFYSIPLLAEVLSIQYLEHYALFITTMYLLSKTNISLKDLEKCEKDILNFVAFVEIHYGVSAMTFNVHLLLHAVKNVKWSGPLWATSAFPFESFIFILKNHVNGPKGVDQQMANKSLQRLLYKFTRPRNGMLKIVREFCDSCISEKRFTASAKSIAGTHFFNSYVSSDTEDSTDQEIFLRCIFNGTILTSGKYEQNNSFNDSVV